MANFDKWARGAAGHLLKHFERAKDERGEYVKFGNRDIDPTRTHLNYNLAPDRSEGQYNFIKRRCDEVYCLNRKDVNVLCSWIVTAPANLPDGRLPDFFQASYDALANEYGEENVVSAYVHMDESGRPHMHFAFIPIVYDHDKERFAVNAKKRVTRTDLCKFHPWFERELEERLGYHVDVINEATKDGNKSITELKTERELEKQREIAQKTSERLQELSDVEDRVEVAEERLEALRRPVAVAQDERDAVTSKIKHKRFPKRHIIRDEEYQRVMSQFQSAVALSNENANLRRDVKQLEQTISKERAKRIELTRENEDLRVYKNFVEKFLAQSNLLDRFYDFIRSASISERNRSQTRKNDERNL